MAEAQTLTYDANEQAEGELNAEEKEALEVGEKLAEQQETLLAGKFKDAEDLEKGYIELQKKLGSQEKGTEEGTTETKDEKVEEEKPKETDTAFLDTLWEESQKEFSKDTIDKLQGMKAEEVAQMFLDYRSKNEPSESAQLTDENVTQLKGIVGGEQQYDDMMKWAGENLQEKEVKMYDAVMEKGDPLAAFFAVQALTYRFKDSQGVDGELLQGKAAPSKGDTFRSQAEVVRAMSDPKYESDPAYRQDIYDKLERSNLQF
tara:strand:- start:51 stop:830 length:780 start_codon:yes stop_codon:yes gene_type:complete